MGLWNFVKDAGKSLFGGAAEASEVKPDQAAAGTAAQTEAIRKEIKDLGLNASGVDLRVEGDKVVLSGKAADPETREKLILAAGNVAGVSAVETEDDDGDEPVFYTVVKGDTLSAIAKRTLGNANRYQEIFEANRPMLTHPDKIYPGQVLRIPKG